jgi:hypothetical protein
MDSIRKKLIYPSPKNQKKNPRFIPQNGFRARRSKRSPAGKAFDSDGWQGSCDGVLVISPLFVHFPAKTDPSSRIAKIDFSGPVGIGMYQIQPRCQEMCFYWSCAYMSHVWALVGYFIIVNIYKSPY